MPIADFTTIANLALDHIGEPYLADMDLDSGTAAESVRLHFPQCVETVLEGHVWSFATRSVYLTPASSFFDSSSDQGFYSDTGDYFLPDTDDESPVSSGFKSCFWLPADCLRLVKIQGEDIDIPRNRFEIQGRYLMLEESDAVAPLVDYITKDPPVTDWPMTFVDAVAFLLASRLATKLTQDPNLSGSFLQKHEQSLGKARSKDARETRSKENSGPRMLAARSSLVRARYGKINPPY